MSFKVTIKPPMKEVSERYRQALKEVTTFATVFDKIAIYLDRWNKQNFKTEGGKVGGWKKLARGGRFTKSGVFDPTAKVLQDTGRLRLSYLPFSSSTEGGIGSDLDYAEAHNSGLGNLPVRRMIPEKVEVIDDVMKIADLHTKKSLKRIT